MTYVLDLLVEHLEEVELTGGYLSAKGKNEKPSISVAK